MFIWKHYNAHLKMRYYIYSQIIKILKLFNFYKINFLFKIHV